MSQDENKVLLGVNRPQEQRPSNEPLEKHGILTDVILPVVPATAVAIGAVAGKMPGAKNKDK